MSAQPDEHLFETSGMAEVRLQLERSMPPMINRVGAFSIGMVVGAAIVFAAVMIFAR